MDSFADFQQPRKKRVGWTKAEPVVDAGLDEARRIPAPSLLIERDHALANNNLKVTKLGLNDKSLLVYLQFEKVVEVSKEYDEVSVEMYLTAAASNCRNLRISQCAVTGARHDLWCRAQFFRTATFNLTFARLKVSPRNLRNDESGIEPIVYEELKLATVRLGDPERGIAESVETTLPDCPEGAKP